MSDVYDISITLPIDTRRINLKELKKLMKNFDEEN